MVTVPQLALAAVTQVVAASMVVRGVSDYDRTVLAWKSGCMRVASHRAAVENLRADITVTWRTEV